MNYFYTDEYGVIHGRKYEETAQKKGNGNYTASNAACAGGYPIYTEIVDGVEIIHDVYIYAEENLVYIDGNINSGKKVKFESLPQNIQDIVTKLGY